jgi:hypothetical protein
VGSFDYRVSGSARGADVLLVYGEAGMIKRIADWLRKMWAETMKEETEEEWLLRNGW